MRLLVILLTILLFLNILGFVLTNLDTRVGVTVWRTEYPDVPLFAVVVLSVVAGIVYAGVIAVAEGANLRLTNHRLRREIQKLETEMHYLRSQPTASSRAEPDAIGDGDAAPRPAIPSSRGARESAPASAPVYGGEDDWGPGSDDDVYTGGRAV